MTTHYLVDTSALARLERDESLDEAWADHIANGHVNICSVTELEFLYSARSIIDRRRKLSRIRNAYPSVLMPDAVPRRAQEIQEELTMIGRHRSAGPIDLLVAATAELNGLTLLHYDRDFETIAEATEQPTQWLVPPGSIA